MNINIDLTEEEIMMIRLALEDRGDWFDRNCKDGKTQDHYYDLAEKFRENEKSRKERRVVL